MHKIIIVLLSTLLIVAPVFGQAIPVTPTPAPSGSTDILLQRLASLLETMSANDAQTINASVLLLGIFNLLFFGGGLIFVWRGGLKPLHQTMESDRKRADKAEKDADEANAAANTTRLQIAQTLREAAVVLANISTKTDDDKRTKAAAEMIVDGVNTHTDEAIKPAVDSANEAVADLKKLSEQMKTLVTQKHFNDGMKDMQKQLDIIIEKMERKADAPCPPAAESPSAEGSKVEQVDTNSKAKE